MAEDTYPEELYIADWDIYDYDDDLWYELLDSIALEESLETGKEEAGEYDAEFYEGQEEYEEADEPQQEDDWEWFNRE
jgi:hypothetical protein